MNLLKDTIISFDIETTGLAAGNYSMIELGAVAFRDGKEISHFYGALKELPELGRSESTMDFWKKHQDGWREIKTRAEDPKVVMKRFYEWVYYLPHARTLAANPAPFDCSFLFWYLNEFIGEDAVGELFRRHRAIDIRTAISLLFNVRYSSAERNLIPKSMKEGLTITHNALEDAREQGVSFINLLSIDTGIDSSESDDRLQVVNE
jgi:DNA polymerase III alpha subunit (gram-positive type)